MILGTANLLVQSQAAHPAADAVQAWHVAKVGGVIAVVLYGLVLYIGCAWAVEPRRAHTSLEVWNALCDAASQQRARQLESDRRLIIRHDAQIIREERSGFFRYDGHNDHHHSRGHGH